ncbi:pheromone maturation dipeptidyl aminopeptidase [Niveomyces insectorum RCEF 264]|uniref:Probable dipeptidyl-aminopeptidase B n=1 Tax=Niveomyces insectorum RCEF 264 TaxID=1081102 RepID=A0A167Z5S3_9HYPO|nr:pheromone maturation dipeptidyl aminopeptidase [Niveomyces insectorum RCEF 264]
MDGHTSFSPPPPPPPPVAPDSLAHRRASHDSDSRSSVSTTSLIFERISERLATEAAVDGMTTAGGHITKKGHGAPWRPAPLGRLQNGSDRLLSEFDDDDPLKDELSGDYDLETGPFLRGTRAGNGTAAGMGAGDGAFAGASSNNTTSANLAGTAGLTRLPYTKMDRGLRRLLCGVTLVLVVAWLGGFVLYVSHRTHQSSSSSSASTSTTAAGGSGSGHLDKITRDQLDAGFWSPKRASIRWVAGAQNEDGLLLETNNGASGDKEAYLTVEDVRSLHADGSSSSSTRQAAPFVSRVLVKSSTFQYGGTTYHIGSATPSKDLQWVLLGVTIQANWRHSTTAAYFVLDVATQTVQPLVPGEPEARVQLALWSPTSDAVAFTRDNNLYLRQVPTSGSSSSSSSSTADASLVQAITTDGGAELFYGVPDWVYEEEVLAGPSATWWSPDGRYLAFLRTNETGVPSYPVQYFIERPSGTTPPPGEENYPEVRQIKYPKAGAHNPVVDLQFYDVRGGGGGGGNTGNGAFTVPVAGDFADDDRLITTVLWAGPQKVLIKETNRVSDVMRVVVVDVAARTGQAVRTVDVGRIDGGWFEISQRTRYVPADPARQRPHDGYIDTVVYNDGDHLAYFSPPENPDPVMLTAGPGWEVVDAPAAVDLARNLVYYVATTAGATQRHVYSVHLLDGTQQTPVTNTSAPGFYTASFSAGAGFVLLEYRGPGVPWQKVQSTPAAAAADRAPSGRDDAASPAFFAHTLEDNAELAERVRTHALPELHYGTLDVSGYGGGAHDDDDDDGKPVATLNYVERRPPNFDPAKRYPVLFQQYSGPGSQEVKQEFRVDFQSYVAASLGYVVVTVDPRGTGFMGRRHRVLVRGRLGVVEAHDHIAAARHWASQAYVDPARLAIWGWSYGGFATLKTLEQDAGRTFRYGMAVAPVTDWRFYDSVYTERYMGTPQANGGGYDASAVQNATALAQNVRFLVLHGVADDNVHLQNSLALLDRLDVAGASNYDVHVFPDSDHGIRFHNGNQIVYDKLENWLVNAFNGEWLKVAAAKPHGKKAK